MRVYFVAMLCAGRFGLGWAHDEFIFACHMFMDSHAYVPSILYILLYLLFGTFLIVSLSFSLSLPFTLVASWHLNVNLFRPGTLFVPGHLLLLLHLTPLLLTSDSVMRRPNWTSWRTSHVWSRSRTLPWSYRSSTPICTDLITLYLSFLLAFKVYVW